MATPAAILQIAVEANTRSATSQLTKLDRKLTSIDKTTATATTRTSALGTASKTTGSHLASAARYAAGAAAAYISISQAKAAVTTTQDLAKATLGLQKNLGLAGRDAGEWAAAASSRGVDTTKLGMAFKTLSTQVEAARGGSAAAKEMFDGLGISMKELDAGSRDVQGLMLQIADGMDKAGAGTSRMNDVSKLFGRSYAGIAPLIRDGSDALKENLQQTEKYGAALHGKVLADQEKLRSALIESKTAWLGLKVTFAEAVTPALTDATEQFDKIARILADPKLTDAERFKKVGEILSGWATKALDAFTGILPTMISKAGEAAPKIAGALVQGFIEAPIWGKVFLAGWLLKAMGGLKMAAAAGATIGTTVAGAMAARIAATAAWTSLAGTLAMFAPLMAPVGVAMGVAILGALSAYMGTKFAPVLERVMNVSDVTKKISADFNVPIDKAQQVVDFMKAHPGLGAEEALNRMDRSIQHTGWVWGNTLDNIKGDTRSGVDVIAAQMSRGIDFGDKMGHMVKDLGVDFTLGMDVIKSATRGAVDVVAQQFARGIDAGKKMEKEVSASIDSLANSVAKGFGNIAGMTNKALAAFGVKSVAFAIGQGFDKGQGKQRGGIIHAQQGMGVLVPGSSTGDRHPALLESGEVVLNRKAVAAMGGANRANRINSMIPRFASGGKVKNTRAWDAMVSMANAFERADEPYLWGGGHGGFLTSPTATDCSGFVSAVLHAGGLLQGAPMDSSGLMSWGKPGTGPLTVFANPEHTFMRLGGSYYGTSGSNPGGGAGLVEGGYDAGYLSGFVRRTMDVAAGSVAGVMAQKIARQVLKGPDGPLKSIGQGALDKVRGAANRYIASKAPSGSLGGGDAEFPHATGSFTNVWPKVNPDLKKWQRLMGQIVSVESGGDPHAGGPGTSNPGHAGWYQYDSPTWAGDAPTGAPGWPAGPYDPAIASRGAGNAIRNDGMAGVIQRWTTWDGVPAVLAKGGIAKLAKGGKPTSAVGPGGGRGHGFAPLPDAIRNALDKLTGHRGRVEQLIANQETLDAFASSPMGSELSAGERFGQIYLNTDLFETLKSLRRRIKQALGILDPDSPARGGLRTKLGELEGAGGTVGSILATKAHLDDLMHPTSSDVSDTSTARGMSISDLVSLAQTVRYQSLPVMHGGGVVPGPAGTNVPIMAQAGETVTPAGGGAIYADIYIGGEKIAEHVQAEIRKSDRASHEYFRAAPV